MATHAELFRAAYACGITKKERLHVQYKKQGMGICAEVVECFECRGQEWVKLWNQLDGYFARPASVLEICQGHADGMCACAEGAVSRLHAQRAAGENCALNAAQISTAIPEVHFSRAGVVAPHESPNFRTPALSPTLPQGA